MYRSLLRFSFFIIALVVDIVHGDHDIIHHRPLLVKISDSAIGNWIGNWHLWFGFIINETISIQLSNSLNFLMVLLVLILVISMALVMRMAMPAVMLVPMLGEGCLGIDCLLFRFIYSFF